MDAFGFSILELILDKLDNPVDVGVFLQTIGGDRRFHQVHQALLTKTFTTKGRAHNGLLLQQFVEKKKKLSQEKRASRMKNILETILWIGIEIVLVSISFALVGQVVYAFRDLILLTMVVLQTHGWKILVGIIVVSLFNIIKR